MDLDFINVLHAHTHTHTHTHKTNKQSIFFSNDNYVTNAHLMFVFFTRLITDTSVDKHGT